MNEPTSTPPDPTARTNSPAGLPGSNPGPVPPPLPPPVAPPEVFSLRDPAREDPEERQPILGLAGTIEALLRQPRRVMVQVGMPHSALLGRTLFLIIVVCALGYGLIVGTFSGGDQLWAAPIKTALGLLLSALICLPSLYIFACLSGVQARLSEVIGLMAGFLALTTLLLIGFAPVAWVFSQSTNSLAALGALHLIFAAISTAFGWRLLRDGLARLARGHTGALRVWMVIFILVALQMSTALRPLLGTAKTFLPDEKRFFVGHWIECLNQETR